MLKMSESNRVQNDKVKYVQVKPTDVDRFFKAVGAPGVCGICGSANWVLIDPPTDYVYAVSASSTSGNIILGGGGNIPVIALACAKCFYLRMHAAIPVMDWIDKNPDGEVK
jgi:hypothetical protein